MKKIKRQTNGSKKINVRNLHEKTVNHFGRCFCDFYNFAIGFEYALRLDSIKYKTIGAVEFKRVGLCSELRKGKDGGKLFRFI